MRHTELEFLSIEATQVIFLLVTILNVLQLIAGTATAQLGLGGYP